MYRERRRASSVTNNLNGRLQLFTLHRLPRDSNRKQRHYSRLGNNKCPNCSEMIAFSTIGSKIGWDEQLTVTERTRISAMAEGPRDALVSI